MTGQQRRLRPVPAAGPRRAVLYRRVSAVMGRSGEAFMSPDLQLASMRELARRRDLVEVAIIDDIDVSGRTFARDGIRQVLDMARARQIDVVAFYDLARLGRNVRESLAIIEELRECGVAVMSANEQIDDSPEGQFQLTIWLGLAQLYSDQIGRRWREVHEHRARRGLLHGPVAPLGYLKNSRGRLEPDPVWAPRVVEFMRRFAAGESLRSLRFDFAERYGRRLSASGIRGMVDNPLYVGRVRFRDREYPADHQPIVEDSLWRQVQRRRSSNRDLSPRLLQRAWPLAGLAVCDLCDGPLQRNVAVERRGVKVARLQCSRQNRWRDCQGIGTPRMELVEQAVLAQLAAKVEEQGFTVRESTVTAAIVARRAAAKADAARLRRSIADTERALGRLTADRARRTAGLTETAFRTASDELEQALADAHRQLALAEMTVEAPKPRVARRAVDELMALWPDPDVTASERHRLLAVLIRQVRLTRPDTWRVPVADRVDVTTTWE